MQQRKQPAGRKLAPAPKRKTCAQRAILYCKAERAFVPTKDKMAGESAAMNLSGTAARHAWLACWVSCYHIFWLAFSMFIWDVKLL